MLLSEEAAEHDRPKAAAIGFDRPGAAAEHLFAPAGKLEKFIRYLDSLASGNGQLELLELEDAFRRLRSECVTAAKQADGAKYMEKLLANIADQGLTLRNWFSEACARASNGDESTLSFEHFKVPPTALCRPNWLARMLLETLSLPPLSLLKEALEELAAKPENAFSDTQVVALIRFINVNADEQLSLDEFAAAAHRADRSAHAIAVAEYGQLLKRIENHMQTYRMRVSDLYYSIDTDHKGHISCIELREKLRSWRIADDTDGGANPNAAQKTTATSIPESQGAATGDTQVDSRAVAQDIGSLVRCVCVCAFCRVLVFVARDAVACVWPGQLRSLDLCRAPWRGSGNEAGTRDSSVSAR